jgi:hypothetical protein
MHSWPSVRPCSGIGDRFVVLAGDLERVAEMVADSVWFSVFGRDAVEKARPLSLGGRRLSRRADEQLPPSKDPPSTPDAGDLA